MVASTASEARTPMFQDLGLVRGRRRDHDYMCVLQPPMQVRGRRRAICGVITGASDDMTAGRRPIAPGRLARRCGPPAPTPRPYFPPDSGSDAAAGSAADAQTDTDSYAAADARAQPAPDATDADAQPTPHRRGPTASDPRAC